MEESEYKQQLQDQRHLYKWCLINIGKYSESEANEQANVLYLYKPSTDKYRWLVFHDDAWHWAMLKIKGEQYWINFPEFKSPIKEYLEEYKKINNENT